MEFVLICCRAECRILRADARALHIITEIRGHKHYYNPWSMFRWSVAWQKVSDLSLMSGREYKKICWNTTTRFNKERPGKQQTRKRTKNFEGKLRFDSRSDDPDVVRSWHGPILAWPDLLILTWPERPRAKMATIGQTYFSYVLIPGIHLSDCSSLLQPDGCLIEWFE